MATCPLHNSTTTCPHCALFARLPLPPGDSAALEVSASDLWPSHLPAQDAWPGQARAWIEQDASGALALHVMSVDDEALPASCWQVFTESPADQAARAALVADLAEARALLHAQDTARLAAAGYVEPPAPARPPRLSSGARITTWDDVDVTPPQEKDADGN